jgi:hypothetical protein
MASWISLDLGTPDTDPTSWLPVLPELRRAPSRIASVVLAGAFFGPVALPDQPSSHYDLPQHQTARAPLGQSFFGTFPNISMTSVVDDVPRRGVIHLAVNVPSFAWGSVGLLAQPETSDGLPGRKTAPSLSQTFAWYPTGSPTPPAPPIAPIRNVVLGGGCGVSEDLTDLDECLEDRQTRRRRLKVSVESDQPQVEVSVSEPWVEVETFSKSSIKRNRP